MKRNKLNQRALELVPPIVSILLGIILGWYILFLTNPADSFSGILTVLSGGFNEGIEGIGNVMYAATPIILTGLSVGFSLKTGLFNIGASGQFTVGAFAAIIAGIKLSFLPPFLHTTVAVLCAVLAGAFWGAISGALKAYFNVSEVISGIMLNYVGMLLVNMLIREYAFNSELNRSAEIEHSAEISKTAFDFILPGSNISLSFFAALLIAILVKLILDKTVFGYELKTTGRSISVANAAGINTKKSLLLTLAISGALAGIGGALMFLSDFGDHIPVSETVLAQGYTGISVALLGLSNPIGIVFSGLFIAYITVGGNYLQLFSYTPDVVDMIIAVIVFCGAFVIPIKTFLTRKINEKHNIKEDGRV